MKKFIFISDSVYAVGRGAREKKFHKSSSRSYLKRNCDETPSCFRPVLKGHTVHQTAICQSELYYNLLLTHFH